MATERQRSANRVNARRSTGPRSEAGKSRSRFNALKHGLAAQSPVLPHENAAAFHEMRAALIAHYQPANIQELQLIDHIAHAQLRMERSRRFENSMFDLQLRHIKREHRKPEEPRADDDTGIAACMCASPDFQKGCQVLFRYDGRAESQYFKSVNALHRMREARFRREQAEAKQGRQSVALPASQELPLQPADSVAQTAELGSFGAAPRSSAAHCAEPSGQHGASFEENGFAIMKGSTPAAGVHLQAHHPVDQSPHA